MEVGIGAEVMGTDGKLGELDRVIADAQRDRIIALVVKHGRIGATRHVVPLTYVQRIEEGTVHLDLDEAALTGKGGIADAIHGATEDYTGTPSTDMEGSFQGNLQQDSYFDSFGQLGGKVGGFPGGERLTSDLHDQPAISLGMDIITNDGEKAGEIAAMSFTVEDGAPAKLVLKRPLIARRDPHVELPIAWVKDLAVDGVLLNVSKREVDALLESGATT
jgi:sporulation protein YlmC with PRC-barrel domain